MKLLAFLFKELFPLVLIIGFYLFISWLLYRLEPPAQNPVNSTRYWGSPAVHRYSHFQR